MRIPVSFQLMGRTITVKANNRLQQDRNWSGSANYEIDEIHIAPRSDSYQVSDGKLQQIFCHELAHFLLYHSGGAVNHDLKNGGYIHNNEEFVDLLGSLIHQAFSTMVYSEKGEIL